MSDERLEKRDEESEENFFRRGIIEIHKQLGETQGKIDKMDNKVDKYSTKTDKNETKIEINQWALTVIVGTIVSGAIGAFFISAKKPNHKRAILEEKLKGKNYEALPMARRIRKGQYDGLLDELKKKEINSKNRKTVLEAIAERKAELREKGFYKSD